MNIWLDWDVPVFRMALDVSIRAMALAIAVSVILFVARVRSSRVRHLAWTGVLLAMLSMPLLTRLAPPIDVPFPTLVPVGVSQPVPSEFDSPVPNDVERITAPFASASSSIRANEDTRASGSGSGSEARSIWPAALLGVYVIGVGILLLRLLVGWLGMARLIRSSRLTMIPGRSAVYESDSIAAPVTCGVFRPDIVLPKDWTEWSQEKLQAVIAHERAHIDRRDTLIGLIADVNRAVFWWHPLAWWLRRTLATTAEQACDDEVVGQTGDADGYAAVLVEIADAVRRHGARLSWHGLGVGGSGLLRHRVERLLRGDAVIDTSAAHRAAVAILCVMATYFAVACRHASPPADVQVAESQDASVAIADAGGAESNGVAAQEEAVSVDDDPTTAASPPSEPLADVISVAPAVPSTPRSPADTVTIVSAMFGASSGAADVTPIVRRLIAPDRHEFYAAAPWLEVDPAVEIKSLVIRYRYRDQDHALTTREPGAVSHAILVDRASRSSVSVSRISTAGFPRATPVRNDLVILDAHYGRGRAYRTVTSRLRALIGPDVEPFVVDDTTLNAMGGPNVKSLIVTYSYGGRRTTFVTSSGVTIGYDRLVAAAESDEASDQYSDSVPPWVDTARPRMAREPGDPGPGYGRAPRKELAIAGLFEALAELGAIDPSDRNERVAAAATLVQQALADAQVNIGYPYPLPGAAPIVPSLETATTPIRIGNAVRSLSLASRYLASSSPGGRNAAYLTKSIAGIEQALAELREA